ncbi:heme NO-binding domain-containing protein [Maliponia aquimaris]|uniref:Heme NO binding protein n=1 Tax=Maliponia aquimaris TaxID=1673631 RepID=A0A238KTD8_9RHOB|nr:heme NO-binding domain-containing protein [Maliponia aquimaris]SMX46073.1 Heme NO binding protein [Maliponia aquimaris]
MKGIVFTELLEMAETAVGEEAVDAILDRLDLGSGGVYTAVGHYPCSELLQIVSALGEATGVPDADLQRRFGVWMHRRFVDSYPEFFRDKATALDMLDAIETEVHVEVRKLYPDAELPVFRTRRHGADRLEMIYRSERPLAAFCHGMVEACVGHFGQPARITVEQASDREAVFDVRLER